jgi:hypothetical protein
MSGRRILLGLSAVAFGSILLTDRLGTAQLRSLLAWWPLVVVALGLGHLVSVSDRPWALSGPLITIATGVVLLLFTAGVVDWDLYPSLWPAAIVAGGCAVALIGARWSDHQLPTRDEFQQFICLRGKRLVSRASAFKRADVTVVFGFFELDLSRADLQAEAVINVTVICGSVDIRVSDQVDVRERYPFVLGTHGLVLQTERGPTPSHLTINVLALFGRAKSTKVNDARER